MRHPADDTRGREQRRIQRLGQAEHTVNEAGIHIDVRAHRLVAALLFREHLGGQLFDQLDQVHLVGHALLLGERTGRVLERDRTRVALGIDGVTHAVDQAGAVACRAVQNAAQVVADLALVLPVLDVLLDLLELLDNAQVRAAVTRALERGDRRRDSGIGVRAGGGGDAHGKGRVIAAAVLCVQDEAAVEQLGLVVGELAVRADQMQNVLRG